MLKWAFRTIIFLVVCVGLGAGLFYLVQNTGLAASGPGFRGEGFRPQANGQLPGGANPQFQPGDRPRDFGGERGGEGGGFGFIGGLMGILGRLILFVVVTVIIVVITKLLPKQASGNPRNP